MKNKKILSIFITIILCFTFISCGTQKKVQNVIEGEYVESQNRTPENYSKYTYNFLGEDEIPMQTFMGPTPEYVINGTKIPSLINDTIFSQLKECGINTIIGSENYVKSDLKDITDTLTLCDRYGINYIVFDPMLINISSEDTNYIISKTSQLLNERKEFYSRFSSFAGFFLSDEKSVLKNKATKEAKEFINSEFGENKIAYSNALNYVTNQEYYTGIKGDYSIDYHTYLDRYCKETSLPYLSFDRYPFSGESGVCEKRYDNLLAVRYYADKYNVPFWGYVQTGGGFDPGWGTVRCPTEREFMWDINTMLAYGCKGFAFFTGVQTVYFPDIENGNLGLISLDGKRTAWWYYTKTIDKQISAIEKVLMNSANLGIMVNGNSPDKINDSLLINNEKVKALNIYDSFREVLSLEGCDCLMGCFDYKGKTALYVVNNSLNDDGNAIINFSNNYGYDVIQQGILKTAKGTKLSLNLLAGEGALVVLR